MSRDERADDVISAVISGTMDLGLLTLVLFTLHALHDVDPFRNVREWIQVQE